MPPVFPTALDARQPLARGPCPRSPAAGLPPGRRKRGSRPARSDASPTGTTAAASPTGASLLAFPSLGSTEPRRGFALQTSRSRDSRAHGHTGEVSNRSRSSPALPCARRWGSIVLRNLRTGPRCSGAVRMGRGRTWKQPPVPRGPEPFRRPLRCCHLAPAAGPEPGRAGAEPGLSVEQRLRGWHSRPAPEGMLCPGPEDGTVRPLPGEPLSL